MGQLLFKLNQVPDDEALEVRELLEESGFRTYETHAGFWGLGVSAIWLADDEQLPEARAVLKRYQAQRLEAQRALHEERIAAGEQPTLWQKIARAPVRFVALTLAIVVVLAITLLPFLSLIWR
ncbi:DUF6164 family protein [Marinimicrobium sp. ARAG 43.8]|uniref:DUF6164 family protein n=1 Tax=Marinimicrobium sp. ARAG 43.8 TaxID=3418719 RepID=UPI003CEFC770